MSKGLYIHVPFCRRKCAYCDFCSIAGAEDMISGYVSAVIRNIRHWGGRFDTVYFGGGTPSLLSGEQIYDILSAADIDKNAEITAECNPDSADFNKLRDFYKAGINRLSFGVQSLDNRELRALGRLHTAEGAVAAIDNARKAGYKNISADIMMGIPYQNGASLIKSIEGICSAGVSHISAYMLKIEAGTPLADNEGLTRECADGDTLADLYLEAVNLLEGRGFHQYEISNFAREGMECKHNLKYWRCEEYLGIGPGAHSLMNGARFAVPEDIKAFIEGDIQQTEITDNAPCTSEEKMMLALRLSEGFPISLAGENGECPERLIKAARPMEKAGLLRINGGRIRLTAAGFAVSNEIICRLTDVL